MINNAIQLATARLGVVPFFVMFLLMVSPAQVFAQTACEEGVEGESALSGHYCEVRTFDFSVDDALTIETSDNVEVAVAKEERSRTYVVATLRAYASSDEAAEAIIRDVFIKVRKGQVSTSGPELDNEARWIVTYAVLSPKATNVTITGAR